MLSSALCYYIIIFPLNVIAENPIKDFGMTGHFEDALI